MKVPESVGELTPDWFSDLLSSNNKKVTVRSAELETVGAGSGMMSVVRRATLTYSSGSGPKSLIVKLPTEIKQNRENRGRAGPCCHNKIPGKIFERSTHGYGTGLCVCFG